MKDLFVLSLLLVIILFIIMSERVKAKAVIPEPKEPEIPKKPEISIEPVIIEKPVEPTPFNLQIEIK